MKQQDRPTLEEQYAVASSTSDLGLPHGDGAGAQGILAAAAWTEVHLGSALRRLRTQWENSLPRRKAPRSHAQLMAAGMTSKQATRQHAREAISNRLTHEREKRALKLRIPEYRQVWDALMVQAVRNGSDQADAKALAVLDRWLDDPRAQPDPYTGEHSLWAYLTDCLNRAQAGLRQGVGGHTKHELEG